MPEKTDKLSLPKGTLIPNHISVIMDGNGRWARARGLSVSEGHKAGYIAITKVIKASRDLGVHTVTLWGFSTENWSRPTREIQGIMKLVMQGLKEYEKDAHENKVRFIHLGRKDRLPKPVLNLITKMEEETKKYTNYTLNIALDYGGRDEILRAAKKAIDLKIPSNRLDDKTFSSLLDTKDQPYPYPDLFIRTSGEQRTSGFLPWQTIYSEFYWEPNLLPDFTQENLKKAILDFSRRRRRFGGREDEANHLKFRPEVAAKFEINWWRLQNIPEGVKFREYAYEHIKEQFGLSTKLAKEAAFYMIEAMSQGNQKDWKKAGIKLAKFYKLVKDEVKLAFEPSIVASLEIKSWQNKNDEEAQTDLLAETYRISEFQAKKAAHLRVLAEGERQVGNWELAEGYLVKYYKALKDRVA